MEEGAGRMMGSGRLTRRYRLRLLFLRTQKAHFKTTNVKKLDAAIKIYGALVESLTALPNTEASNKALQQQKDVQGKQDEQSYELRIKVVDKLTSILSHPFPRVREMVIEELWTRCAVGKEIDVTAKGMGKEDVARIRMSIIDVNS